MGEEAGSLISGGCETVVDVSLGLVQRQRAKPAESGDALHQLLLFGQRQPLRQLRLPGQNNLHQLGDAVSKFES